MKNTIVEQTTRAVDACSWIVVCHSRRRKEVQSRQHLHLMTMVIDVKNVENDTRADGTTQDEIRADIIRHEATSHDTIEVDYIGSNIIN